MTEAARLKGVSYNTVSRAFRSGKLPGRRVGRMVFISPADLEAWSPMRDRAPHKYQRREPNPAIQPAVIDLASGERLELVRRLSGLYEVIHSTAMHRPLAEFGQILVERFSQAMEFTRVTIWIISDDRATAQRLASYGAWYSAGKDPIPDEIPFVDGWDRNTPEPRLINRVDFVDSPNVDHLHQVPRVFIAPLRVGTRLIGFINADRGGESLEITPAQIDLASSLAVQIALAIDLNRTRQAEAEQRQKLERSLARARAIVDISLGLNTGLDLHGILRMATQQLTRQLGGIRGGIGFLLEPQMLLGLWIFSDHTRSDEWMAINLHTFPGVQHALAAGRPTLCSYAQLTDEEQTLLDHGAIRSGLITPLLCHSELLGVAFVFFAEDAPQLTPQDYEFNDAIAAQCLLAIRFDRLAGELRGEPR